MNVKTIMDNERIVMPAWGLIWTFWTAYVSVDWHASGGDPLTVALFAATMLLGGWGAVYVVVQGGSR